VPVSLQCISDKEDRSVETFLLQRYFILPLHERTRRTKPGCKAIFNGVPTNAVAFANLRAFRYLHDPTQAKGGQAAENGTISINGGTPVRERGALSLQMAEALFVSTKDQAGTTRCQAASTELRIVQAAAQISAPIT